MESQTSHSPGRIAEPWIALALCAAAVAARALEHLVRNRNHPAAFVPDGLALAAVGLAAGGNMRWSGRPSWLRVRQALLWSGLLLMVWAANGLPLDLLRITRLIPLGVDWPGLARRTLALAAALALARLVLARPAASASAGAATWYGYAAFVLALPYPILRTSWALGGTLGLSWPGAAGPPMAWLACIPWLLAAALSLLLVSTRRWLPRHLLLAAGWFATAVVALIGPGACWILITKVVASGDLGLREHGIALWVPALFYGSWLLWPIAAGAATRSYQLRSAALAGLGAGARD